MKKAITILNYFLLILTAGIVLASCTGMRKLQEDVRNSREPGKDKFIVTNDNQEIESQKLTFKSPLFKAQKIVLDNGTEVKVKDIKAYQDDNAFYLRLNQTPYGFAHRMKRGAINMYRAVSSESYYDPNGGAQIYNPGTGGMTSTGGWSRRTVLYYFIEKNNSGDLVRFTAPNVENMVRDYQPAMDFVNTYKLTKAKCRTWSWINIGATVGGLALMLTSVHGNGSKVQPQGYVGLGLFFGGIISGFVNTSRRVRNMSNLELAVDEYNSGSRKKRK